MAPCVHINPVHIEQIACGDEHCCAIARGSKIACWGDNGNYQAGGGSTSSDVMGPTPIDFGGGEVAAIALSDSGSCLLMADASLRCWGEVVGEGVDTPVKTPTRVDVGGDVASPCPSPPRTQARSAPPPAAAHRHTLPSGDVALIAGGPASYAFCALLVDRITLKCWGYNAYGQLGTGGAADESVDTPTQVAFTLTKKVEAVSMGEKHGCLLLVDVGADQVACWGDNTYGQLASTDDGATPKVSDQPKHHRYRHSPCLYVSFLTWSLYT